MRLGPASSKPWGRSHARAVPAQRVQAVVAPGPGEVAALGGLEVAAVERAGEEEEEGDGDDRHDEKQVVRVRRPRVGGAGEPPRHLARPRARRLAQERVRHVCLAHDRQPDY